ncbi:MAG: Gfo/Idh/MocA family oxidoreductase [Silicimonas sp.]|nr:Gfo/Idh/MocA family oxidoreductase [Silicimonas sp.]NNL35557.1 Gfo/Idh/MocA family oxidoreductase [Silicimonas sp.]
MSEPQRIALVGIGKIAVDQHVPAIRASDDWSLEATVSRNGSVDDVEAFRDIDAMLTARPDIGVVSLCLPPVPRFAYALAALKAGRHVMLEKPPGATIAEVQILDAMARERGLTLFATWHSRKAKGVADAKKWLSDKSIKRAHVTWRESVRKWHPGQDWVFEPGGMGVFDPGINALSILTEIMPVALHLDAADLSFPSNRQTPIAATLAFSNNVSAEFDWREEDADIWDIEVETNDGTIALRNGGNVLEIGGKAQGEMVGMSGEYPALYSRMADLVRRGKSDVDLAPMIHVSDAMTLGRRTVVDPFDF